MYTYENKLNRPSPADPELRKVNPIILDILYRRGYRADSEMLSILSPDIANALQPLDCWTVDAVLPVLEKVVHKQMPTVIYHSYSVDGIAASAVAEDALNRLGAPTHHYANKRETGSPGICKNGIEQIQRLWSETDVILTFNNESSERDAVEYAEKRGLTVIAADYHAPTATVPPVAAAPKQADGTCSYDTGLIFRIMLDLYRRLGEDIAPLLDLLDLVALASVSVHGPATDKNRALVQQGMKLIASGKRPFFRALAQEFHPSTVNIQDAVACYVPIINSVSRMDEDGDTALVVEAMRSQDMDLVEHLVRRFGEFNERRKKETDRQVSLAKQKLKNSNNPAVIISDREFKVEMIDMIAGRLKDTCKRPVIVLAYLQDEYGLLKGFGRSIDGFTLIDAFDDLSIYLTRYHGNSRSVEFSILEENLGGFVGDFMKLAAERTGFEKTIALDAVLDGTALTE